MKRLLNTLYITSPDSYVSKDGNNVVVSINGAEVGKLPIHNLHQIICFGRSGASPHLMRLCIENNVSLSFMTSNGRFLASVYGETKGNVLLRRRQYRIADDEHKSLEISKNMIAGKLANSITLLKKNRDNHKEAVRQDIINCTIDKLYCAMDSLKTAMTPEQLRGIEGDAAKSYFDAYNCIILKNREYFFIRCRNRRPPRDRMNSLLSFLYSILANDVKSALESVGLDSYVGFLHTDRPGRPSLALDMMEEIRPLADRVALRLVNLRMIQPEGFLENEGGSITMDDETRKTVIDAWQSQKAKEIFHPFLKEKIQVGMIPFVQSMLLSKFIYEEIDGYPPFIMKRVIE